MPRKAKNYPERIAAWKGTRRKPVAPPPLLYLTAARSWCRTVLIHPEISLTASNLDQFAEIVHYFVQRQFLLPQSTTDFFYSHLNYYESQLAKGVDPLSVSKPWLAMVLRILQNTTTKQKNERILLGDYGE